MASRHRLGSQRNEKTFIEQTLEQRLKEQRELQKSSSIQKSPARKQIGRIANGKVGYTADECFFSKEDIPARALEIKKEVIKSINPDNLGVFPKKWNPSSFVAKENPEINMDHERRLFNIRLGLIQKPFLPFEEKEQPQGVDTRNHDLGWNGSYVVDKRQLKTNFKAIESESIRNSKEFQIKNYKSPLHRLKSSIDLQKESYLHNPEFMAKAKEELEERYPNASESKIFAEIMKKQRKIDNKKREEEYEKRQAIIEKRVSNVLGSKKKLNVTKSPSESMLFDSMVKPSNPYEGMDADEAKLYKSIAQMRAIKKAKPKKKTLRWVYDNI